MAQSFFFYDLETSGRDFRRHRIMQFAGIRTDLNLVPTGQRMNLVVKLSPEVIPEPMATLITGVTPQQAVAQGISERAAVAKVLDEAFTPDTIVVGFNNVRFDDEYIRYTCYRNFHDAYEWAYRDGRSRWDLLDVVRLTRALRPEGIVWPVDDAGKPVNKLERITAANGVEHLRAHDALSDVEATIAVARLLRDANPKMFQFLLDARGKERVAELVSTSRPAPFVYASGQYGSAHDFTTVAVPVGKGQFGKVIVYDLRFDPTPFLPLSVDELHERLFSTRAALEAKGLTRVPVKELAANKCPAVAPWSTWTPEVETRLALTNETIRRHWALLQRSGLPDKLTQLYNRRRDFAPTTDVDGALYDGFVGDGDKALQARVRDASDQALAGLAPPFRDQRLAPLLLRYKGRNAPEALTPSEHAQWQAYVAERRAEDLPGFTADLAAVRDGATEAEHALLDELERWAGLQPKSA